MAVVGMLSCYTTTLLLYTVKALRCLEQLNMVTQNSLKKYAINIVLVYPCLEEEGLYCLTLVVFPPSIQNKNLHCNFLSNYRMQRPDVCILFYPIVSYGVERFYVPWSPTSCLPNTLCESWGISSFYPLSIYAP